jgi:RNA polymerase sigma factor (sigma-70 family)
MATSEGAETAPEPEDVRLLIAQYRDDAYRLARHLVRSSAEAEDLAHTAILNVLRRADNISDAAHVRAYLLAAVRNAWRNQLRARGGRRFIGADYAEMIPSTDPQPEERVITFLDASIAKTAFDSLSITSQEVIRLRYMESLNFPELAERLGITSVAARQRAHRAREELVGACMDVAAGGGTGNCKVIRRRLGRYHRGLLSQRVRDGIETHLDMCRECASCYEQLIDLFGHRIGQARIDKPEERER